MFNRLQSKERELVDIVDMPRTEILRVRPKAVDLFPALCYGYPIGLT